MQHSGELTAVAIVFWVFVAVVSIAGMIQGQVLPVRTAHARQSMAKDYGANPMSNNQAQELIA